MFKRFLQPVFLLVAIFISWFAHYHYLLKHRWQLSLSQVQKPLQIIGVIDDIPVAKFHGAAFLFHVTRINNQPISTTIKLGWYQQVPALVVGQRWQLWVRLKPPIGLHNPGGFNYEAWLVHHGICATGSVITRLPQRFLGMSSGYWLLHLRERVQQAISNAVSDHTLAGILSALSVGLRNYLTQEDWKVFQKTGTSHLVAISGLHIGLVAGVVYAIVYFLWRLWPSLLLTIPAVSAAQISSILAALIYTALSGFATPAQRALIMLVCFVLGSLYFREIPFYQRWLSAFLMVLLLQPFAIFSESFFLSFYAVAILGYLLCARIGAVTGWRHWGRIQMSLFLALIPLSIWYFQQTSLVALITNLFAIPWIGFVIVPGVLLGVLFLLSGATGIAYFIFHLTALLLKPLWMTLTFFAHYPWSIWHYTFHSVWLFGLMLIGMMLVLAPAGLPARWLGCAALLPLLFYHPPHPNHGDFWLTVLDVGEGLSVVVQTENHVLLYDTGAHSPGGFDMGAFVVLPALRYFGVRQLDQLMISHGDNDHSGGANAVVSGLPVNSVLTSAPKLIKLFHGVYCHRGQSWVWDDVKFTVLSPFKNIPYLDNNSSCVLKITNQAGSALLTGDIEQAQEAQLVQNEKNMLSAAVVIAPHHGSRTSSSLSFLQAISPKICLISLGAYNRYHFPGKTVLERYRQLGTKMYTTAKNGAISVRFLRQGQVRLHVKVEQGTSLH